MQERTLAARRPGHDHHAGACARWRDARFHGALSGCDDAIAATYPEFDRRFMFMGVARFQPPPWSCAPSTGTSARAPRQNWRGRCAAHERAARCDCLPDHAAEPGQGFRERPINFVIQTSDSYDNLARVSQQLMAEMAKNPGFVAARQRPAAQQARNLHGRRPRTCADMGVSVESVARTVETMLGGVR